MNSNLLIAVLGALLAVVASVYGLRFVYDYRVKDQAVEIVLFHVLPVYRVLVGDIERIQKVSWRELGVGGSVIRLGNRLAGRCVLIQKRSGWARRVVITPRDPDEFIDHVVKSKRGAMQMADHAG